MTSDGALIVQALFGQCWRLFTEWRIPGTRVSPGMWMLFCFFCVIMIRLAKNFFSAGGGSD